jgi:acyl-CoA dehydrogenase
LIDRLLSGAVGAKVGIIMGKSSEGATLFVVELPDPSIRIERVLDTIDSSMPGGHALITLSPPPRCLAEGDRVPT